MFIALRLLNPSERGHEVSEAEKCTRLIEYAEFVSSKDKPYPFLNWKFPVNMMIYCHGCGKLFDIVVTSAGCKEYRCPACEKVQAFDLDAFTRKAVEQGRKMFRKPRGGR
jgi:phage FluMu protein Com